MVTRMRKEISMGNQRGFTLVELMIAMAVIVIALVGYIGATNYIQRNSEAAFERSIAVQDANRVMEQIRSTSGTGQFPQNVTAAYPNGGVVAGFNNLRNQQVTVAYANATADPLDVTVTVTWLQNGLRNVTLALRSVVTQRT